LWPGTCMRGRIEYAPDALLWHASKTLKLIIPELCIISASLLPTKTTQLRPCRRQLIHFIKRAVDHMPTEIWITKISNKEVVGRARRKFVSFEIHATNPNPFRFRRLTRCPPMNRRAAHQGTSHFAPRIENFINVAASCKRIVPVRSRLTRLPTLRKPLREGDTSDVFMDVSRLRIFFPGSKRCGPHASAPDTGPRRHARGLSRRWPAFRAGGTRAARAGRAEPHARKADHGKG